LAYLACQQGANQMSNGPVYFDPSPSGTNAANTGVPSVTYNAAAGKLILFVPAGQVIHADAGATSVTLNDGSGNLVNSGNLLVPAGDGLDTSAAGALELGATNATSVVVTPVLAASTLTIGGAASTAAKHAATTSASSAITTVETVLENVALVPAGVTLLAGSRVRITAEGTATSSNADTATFTVRAGTLGTTADASVMAFAVTAAGSGTNIPFKAVLEFTVRSLGSAGTAAGSLVLLNNGITGLAASTVTVVPATSSTLATTTATFLDVTFKTSASTTTVTFQDVCIEVMS
jgi:hypothetical protein